MSRSPPRNLVPNPFVPPIQADLGQHFGHSYTSGQGQLARYEPADQESIHCARHPPADGLGKTSFVIFSHSSPLDFISARICVADICVMLSSKVSSPEV